MNQLGSFIKAAGVTPTPPAPQQQPIGIALRQTAPIAPAPVAAVQQPASMLYPVSVANRPIVPQPAMKASDAEEPPDSLAPQLDKLNEARVAWIEGKPRNAPAIWPIFPEPEVSAPETPVSSEATHSGQAAVDRLGTAGTAKFGGQGAATARTTGETLHDAVKVVRAEPLNAKQSALGTV